VAEGVSESGWITSASIQNSTEIVSFVGFWNVPNSPISTKAPLQTLFWWNGVEDLTRSEVLQPVLQWGPASGAGGGAYWSLASWYVNSAGKAIYTKELKVATGDMINGTCTENPKGLWTIIGTDMKTKLNVTLHYQLLTPQQKQAYVTLEAYNLDACADYPGQQSNVTFTGLKLADSDGPISDPKWQATVWVNPAQCGEKTVVNSPKSVSIQYKN